MAALGSRAFSSPHLRTHHRASIRRPTITSLHFPPSSSSSSSSSSPSPFTEKHSVERYSRDGWLYKGGSATSSDDKSLPFPHDSDSIRRNDIALQLPELKNLLKVLRDKRRLQQQQQQHRGGECRPGDVYLVGTGPGDPELLTAKATEVIRGADLVLYDRLVSHDVLDLVGPEARLLYVGKTAGYHSRTQEEIHELLLNFAEAGATVVRLKGGDPLVFGRGGEEMDFLQQQGIHVKVIPGITAASGIAAELGIPLTHRGVASSVRFLTGHSRKGGTDPLFVAENAADPDSTLVVYMGLSTLPALAEKLMHHGLSGDTPAVAVERGTTPQQRLVFAELKDLASKIAEAGLVSPTLIIIGKVVALSSFGGGAGKKCRHANVYLVGTGPGDPELLTQKAKRVIQEADLLLHDRLVSDDVLNLVGPGARLLYVGKTAGYPSRTQEEINELLLHYAETGATVVRLKGGDPLVFGRGGDEMDFLQQQGIHVKVIPGITAASGIAAELGIPLTHRGVANSVRFLTGHSKKGGTDPLHVDENAADPDSTLVVYMGLSTLPSLARKLMHHGLPGDTPAVAVERGTTPQQRFVFSELKDLASKIAEAELVSPTLIMIGKVVTLSPYWDQSVEETASLVQAL